MEQRKLKWGIVVFLITIAAAVGFPFLLWQVQPSKNLDVVIIDKTVPDATYREHKGLMWLLNNMKIQNGSKPFQYSKDYYGFYPLANKTYTTKELSGDMKTPDLIYITDTYGVYEEDFYKNNIHGDRSALIYGGVSEQEAAIISGMLQDNVIIGEFNTLASPTGNEARARLEDTFGLAWSGWIGRYFSDLSDNNMEIPRWIKTDYAMQYGVKWDFEGPGIVFAGRGDKILVLREGIELSEGLNTIRFTEKAASEFHVKNNTKYYYWFEVCSPDKGTEVLANYRLDLTEAGEKIMRQNGLPDKFPAVLRMQNKYTSYYFSGDFADNNMTPRLYQASGMRFLNKITTFDEDTNQNYFFWNVYYPMVETIVKHIK
jgi:hypothetical protein